MAQLKQLNPSQYVKIHFIFTCQESFGHHKIEQLKMFAEALMTKQ